jgi:hypothetical protein
MCIQTVEPYGEPQNHVDLEMTIRKLKNGKSEMIKEGKKELKETIYEII